MNYEARVVSMSASNYYSHSPDKANGSITLSVSDGTTITLQLTPNESAQLFALGLRLFTERQAEIAASIRDIKPEQAMIAPPKAYIDAESEEIPF